MTDTTTTARDRNLEAQQTLGEILGGKSLDRLGEVFADDVVDHDPAPDQPAGLEGIRAFWRDFFTAFPNADITPLVVSADDENVTVVLDIHATHTGVFLGHEATGEKFTARGIQVARFADGKIVERWGATDELGILTQLGLAGA